MKTIVTTLLILAAAATAAPAASAWSLDDVRPVQPDCIQAHPWSDLCNGDVEGFLAYYGVVLAVDPKEPPTVSPGVDCLQVYPWSELCRGNVGGFVGYYVGDLIQPRGWDCVQMYPASELCGGDVLGFVGHYVERVAPILP